MDCKEVNPVLLPLLLTTFGLDAEGLTFKEVLEYIEKNNSIKVSFFDDQHIYSIVNDITGSRMSAPYREEVGFQERVIKHIISLL